MKLKNPLLISFVLGCELMLVTLLLVENSFAQANMSNDLYEVELQNPESDNYKSIDLEQEIKEEIIDGEYAGPNFKAKTGFEYINTKKPMTIGVSSSYIDFGPITPGDPLTRTNRLTLSNGSTLGLTIFASQDHPLRDINTGSTIPDTTCDSGTCNESVSAEWLSLTTFGLGYRCDNIEGESCDSEFENEADFKHFASEETFESMQPVLFNWLPDSHSVGEIVYKVNISSTQPPGIYQNLIKYIAIPAI